MVVVNQCMDLANQCGSYKPKPDGRWKNIQDATQLNDEILPLNFQMHGVAYVKMIILPIDWMTELDLKSDQLILKQRTIRLMEIFEQFSLTISPKKCELEPKQEIVFLGWTWNSATMELYMPDDRRSTNLDLLKRLVKTILAKRQSNDIVASQVHFDHNQKDQNSVSTNVSQQKIGNEAPNGDIQILQLTGCDRTKSPNEYYQHYRLSILCHPCSSLRQIGVQVNRRQNQSGKNA
ncbi:MAG: hypothetical protein EZS28_008744 [Streblomastix strix]|uniref:Reverse transcriptase domain-containing protein n=1 Tax=Streblomastix strix TaxID=222440 RepID=A0A5J4WME8_9EUKA|nr:MAG: hypothetical protein EZS28_008744 [Streblomastix strix]